MNKSNPIIIIMFIKTEYKTVIIAVNTNRLIQLSMHVYFHTFKTVHYNLY